MGGSCRIVEVIQSCLTQEELRKLNIDPKIFYSRQPLKVSQYTPEDAAAKACLWKHEEQDPRSISGMGGPESCPTPYNFIIDLPLLGSMRDKKGRSKKKNDLPFGSLV